MIRFYFHVLSITLATLTLVEDPYKNAELRARTKKAKAKEA
jgi:hypothetical protein